MVKRARLRRERSRRLNIENKRRQKEIFAVSQKIGGVICEPVKTLIIFLLRTRSMGKQSCRLSISIAMRTPGALYKMLHR